MIRRRYRLSHVLMTLHVEPTRMLYRLVPRWRRRQFARGGWCQWDESRLNPARGPVPTLREAARR